MDKIRFGIIGLGNQGGYYALQLFDAGKIANGVLTVGCDTNPVKIENIKKHAQNKEIKYFADYKEMLDSGLCDAVIVATPHYLHPEMAIECLQRKIPVLVDKPAGVYAKQVREMNEAATKSGVPFGMMFNQRTNCLYKKMRELYLSGAVGKLQRVHWMITDWFRTENYYASGSWRATWAGEGGGVLINQCPHQLDLLCWVLNEQPETVRGFCEYGKWHDIEVEDEVTAFLTYKSGATGTFITTTGEAPGENRFEIIGTGGKLICENGKLTLHKNADDTQEFSRKATSGFAMPACTVNEIETDGENPQHLGIINNFTNALLGQEKLFVDGKEGIAGVELMNAIEYSGWHGGEKVMLPINEDAYLQELNARRATSRIKIGNDNQVESTASTFGSGAR